MGWVPDWRYFPASNELVFFKRHHTEVVSDRVAEVFPFVRKNVAEETQYCFGKLVERSVVLIMGNPFMHDAPEAFNWV